MKSVATMRARDKAVILDVIRRFGPLSRVAMHDWTEIRPAGISQLTRELLDEGKIREAGYSDNPTGRKQILLEMNPDAGFVLSLDFDAEQVRTAILDCRLSLVAPVHSETAQLNAGIDGLFAQLLRSARASMATSGLPPGRFLGLGVGDPGLVDPRRGRAIAASQIDFWRDVPLRERFEAELHFPCIVAENTRARTVAERTLGAGGNSDDMIFIEYGRGVGAGIFCGGRVLQGHAFTAGEFGYTHVTENGPPCKCGSFGCLEAIAGIGALENRLRRALRDGGYSVCLDMAGGEIDAITGWQVLEAARQGDKMSIALVEEVGRYLGLGIANLVNLFNPELIVLDKRLSLAGDALRDQIARIVRREALAHANEGLEFRYASLGEEAGLLGVASLVLDTVFEVPALKLPRFLRA